MASYVFQKAILFFNHYLESKLARQLAGAKKTRNKS